MQNSAGRTPPTCPAKHAHPQSPFCYYSARKPDTQFSSVIALN